MSLEYKGTVELATGGLRFSMASDFYRNCLTADPYPHSHPKFELHLAISGTLRVEWEGHGAELPKGAFLLLPPHLPHRIIATEGTGETLSFLCEGTNQKSLPTLLRSVTSPRVIPDTFGGRELLMQVQEELKKKHPHFEDMINGRMMTLFALLSRAAGNASPQATPPVEGPAEQIEQYLAEHRFDPEATCEKLAEEMHLSPRQVHRLCRKYFHASFRSLLTSARMDTAAHRLRTTDVSVTQLAEDMGYAGVASFSAAYKRHFGVSPTKDKI